jgi:hypothetical protein
MSSRLRTARPYLIGFLVVVAAGLGLRLYLAPRPAGRAAATGNALIVIAPYWYNGTWVFDDESAGLRREPFVAGVPEMIDARVKDVPDARDGFRLLASASPFLGCQKSLKWLRGDLQGNYYRLDDPPIEGWICPAMFRYYREAPRTLYIKAERLRR